MRRLRRNSSAAVRRSVPVRTFSVWGDPPPGFFEADLVAHSGPTAKGSFVQTLVLTDIATGWTECAPLLVREQGLLTEVLSELRKVMPFALLGFDSDNDSVFMNETVRDYCKEAGLEFTRCRPYTKVWRLTRHNLPPRDAAVAQGKIGASPARRPALADRYRNRRGCRPTRHDRLRG